MLMTKAYEQTAVYDPTNPGQIRRVTRAYPGDGGYSSFYFNPVGTGGTLNGLRGLNGFDTWPAWAQIATVGGIAAAVGFFVMDRFGDRLKPMLKKVPVVGGALSGHRRRR